MVLSDGMVHFLKIDNILNKFYQNYLVALMYGDQTTKCLQNFVMSYGTSPRNHPEVLSNIMITMSQFYNNNTTVLT